MAGAGYKLFNTGDVLTAAQVNTYLMQQSNMVFASAAARTTALSGVLSEGMVTYLQDTNSLEYYDGTSWIAAAAVGDITGVTAGTGLTGGGTSGAVTLAIDSTVATLTGTQTLTNKTLTTPTINTALQNNPIIKSPEERCTVSATAATGTIAFDTQAQGVLFYTTNASANFTLNFTNVNANLAVGDSISTVFMNTNGATPYYATAFQVDSVAVTPRWAGGTAPTAGNANSIDVYSFTILKTAATPTYTVLAGFTRFA